MKFLNKNAILSLSLASLVGSFGVACEQPKTGGNSVPTNSNSALNSTAGSMNSNSSADSNMNLSGSNNSMIDTKEPEKYQATVLLKLETAGAQNMPLPPLKADVARSGADRRMEFKLPTGETIVYLDKGGRQLIIQPQKRQYAELNQESTGFDVRRIMMPEQIVNQVKNMKGVERVGEEKVDGRDAIKYRFAATTNTQSQAGKVDTESFIFVDKETGLPLRSFTNSAAQGNVQGVNAVNVVTEMNNIRTDVDQSLFAEPTDFRKVPPEEIRSQINVLFSAVTAVVGQMMKTAQPAANPTTSASPAISTSPSASATP